MDLPLLLSMTTTDIAGGLLTELLFRHQSQSESRPVLARSWTQNKRLPSQKQAQKTETRDCTKSLIISGFGNHDDVVSLDNLAAGLHANRAYLYCFYYSPSNVMLMSTRNVYIDYY